jgi:2-oxoglutarate ferredoxin oxidoreductase subunit alpha
VIYYGSTSPAMDEALDALARNRGHPPRRAAPARLPVPGRSRTSSPRTSKVFVVEQNRDAQLRTLLVNEGEIDPAR